MGGIYKGGQDTVRLTNPLDGGSSDRPLLVCVPFAGAGVSAFASWRRTSQGLAVRVAQLPGRDGLLSVPALPVNETARRLADAVVELADGPVAFYGHSLGAFIAYEATRLVEQVHPVALLAVGAAEAPRLAPARTLPETSRSDVELAEFLAGQRGVDISSEAARELIELTAGTVRADVESYVSYRRSEGAGPLAAPIMAFHGIADSWVTEAQISSWSHETASSFSLTTLAGGHFFLEQSAETVLRKIALRLDHDRLIVDPQN